MLQHASLILLPKLQNELPWSIISPTFWCSSYNVFLV
uniref:Uncharacterized protein n=1 Tax=Manihot esculenta TaxID=3983 RepID=A0A2C9UAQ7_MANES